jgi:hypothetical protein
LKQILKLIFFPQGAPSRKTEIQGAEVALTYAVTALGWPRSRVLVYGLGLGCYAAAHIAATNAGLRGLGALHVHNDYEDKQECNPMGQCSIRWL